jgi:hypothetical protein
MLLLVLASASLPPPADPAAVAPAQYELTAYEAPGLLPLPGEVIIPDARKRIPPIVRACGIARVDTQDRTDGAVAFRFHATAGQHACLKKTLPDGTILNSFGTR